MPSRNFVPGNARCRIAMPFHPASALRCSKCLQRLQIFRSPFLNRESLAAPCSLLQMLHTPPTFSLSLQLLLLLSHALYDLPAIKILPCAKTNAFSSPIAQRSPID